MNALSKFIDFVKLHQLFHSEEPILLAVSGGKDSVAMTHLFKLAGFRFSIAHCNFNLRGEESERDERFVRALASGMGVPFHVIRFDTALFAETHRCSTQMAARKLRYDWFETLLRQEGYARVALAHHQNDVIETVLINLVKGTGISGLHGILPKSGALIRPMLFLSANEIEEMVETHQWTFVEDSSNCEDHYLRNKMRHQIVPLLKSLNPSLEETFMENTRRFSETERVLKNVVAKLRSTLAREEDNAECRYALTDLKALDPQSLLVYELLKPYGFRGPVIQELIRAMNQQAQTGTVFYGEGYRAIIDREDLLLSPVSPSSSGCPVFWEESASDLSWGEFLLRKEDTLTVAFERLSDKIYVDSAQLIYPLQLREKKEGDRFMPFGMDRHKRLSDFLVDSKIPLSRKNHFPLLLNGNGEVIWLVGLRQDNRYKLTMDTKKVTIFEVIKK